MEPDIILMDEPCSALDPVSTKQIENLIRTLSEVENFTVLIVTHNMHQAKRISDYTAFMDQGKLVEFGETEKIFNSPTNERTRSFVAGEFG